MSMTLPEMQTAVCGKMPELFVKEGEQFYWNLSGKMIRWPTEGLQVCHEAEKLLPYHGYLAYVAKLEDITIRDSKTKDFRTESATYEQRFEALCRVWWPGRFKE